MEKLKILVACEESQAVCCAFRKLGQEAYSCDIEPCGGEHPEWHIQQDVLPLLNGDCSFKTVDGVEHSITGEWDLIIAHPPCTYLTVTGNRWFNIEKYGEKAIERHKLREEAIDFFMAFANAKCKHICIENPVGVMSTRWRKPDCIFDPTWFGVPHNKRTCLWLIGLKPLQKTNEVEAERVALGTKGKTIPKWYSDAFRLPAKERAKVRSRTFPEVAEAIASQFLAQIK